MVVAPNIDVVGRMTVSAVLWYKFCVYNTILRLQHEIVTVFCCVSDDVLVSRELHANVTWIKGVPEHRAACKMHTPARSDVTSLCPGNASSSWGDVGSRD